MNHPKFTSNYFEKSIISLVVVLITFTSIYASSASKREQNIQIFQGSDPKQRSSYKEFSGKNLNESEVAVLFMGFPEKELRFQSKVSEPLKTSDEIAFDLQITEMAALASKDRQSVLIVEIIFRAWSEERISNIAKIKPGCECPEGPEPIHTTLKFYDQFGNLLMEESKNGCSVNLDVQSISYLPDLDTISRTFAISENGKRFVLCLFCEPLESSGCFVYSPHLKQSYQMKDMPDFSSSGNIAFSPDARFVGFYHDFRMPSGIMADAVTFLDLETKQSTEIPAKDFRGLKVFDNATIMIEHDIETQILYDLRGQAVTHAQNK